MKSKFFGFIIVLFFACSTGIYAQLGIKAGVNLANEIKSFSQSDIAAGFNSNNLTGYQLGLVYQAVPKKSGFGIEIGALLSQKGSTFHFDSIDVVNTLKDGYKELNYVEVPLNIRYHLSLGFLGIYGFGGVYGGYALSGKTVTETTNTSEIQTFQSFMDHVDYGYNFGAGFELFKKIQLGATWSQGLKNIESSGLTPTTNRVFSVNLVYLL